MPRTKKNLEIDLANIEENNKQCVAKKVSKKTSIVNNNEELNNKPIDPKYCQECNIVELNKKLTNFDQQLIINRISTDSDYAKVYLQNFELNTDTKKKDLKGTIKILGNYNKQKKKREAYDVKIFDS